MCNGLFGEGDDSLLDDVGLIEEACDDETTSELDLSTLDYANIIEDALRLLNPTVNLAIPAEDMDAVCQVRAGRGNYCASYIPATRQFFLSIYKMHALGRDEFQRLFLRNMGGAHHERGTCLVFSCGIYLDESVGLFFFFFFIFPVVEKVSY